MQNNNPTPGARQVKIVLPGDDADRDADGVVFGWRRRGDVWEGLVSREVDGKIVTAWLPALVLTPLH